MHKFRLFIVILVFFPLTFLGSVTDTEESLYRNLYNAETSYEIVKAYFDLTQFYKTPLDESSIYMLLSDQYVFYKLDDSVNLVQIFGEMEKAHIQSDTLLSVLDFLIVSTNYFEDCDCDSLKAAIFYELGYMSYNKVYYIEAQTYFLKALEYAEKAGAERLLLKIHIFIGHLYTTIGNYNGAEKAFVKTIQYYSDKCDEKNKVRIHYCLGRVYLYQDKFDEARFQLFKALEFANMVDYKAGVAAIYSELGHVEYADKEYEKALEYFFKLEEQIQHIDKASYILIDYFNVYGILDIGMTYYSTGDYEKAIEWLEKSRSLARQTRQYLFQALSSKYLERIYEEKQNFKLALDYSEEYANITDSLLIAKNLTQINRLEMDYNHLKALNEKKLKRQAIEIEYQKSLKFYQTLTISGVSSLLIVLLLFYIYRLKERENARIAKEAGEKLKSEKEKLQSELDYKNRELTTSVMYLLKKNNLVWNLSEKLKKAILPLNPEAKKPIQDIIKEADANIGNDSWNDFETRFNKVHQDFSNHLLEDFPGLTPNELKLCSFIKLNMSTKEISTITYQSHNSITVARHRLRAKLGVERDENLVSFLSKY